MRQWTAALALCGLGLMGIAPAMAQDAPLPAQDAPLTAEAFDALTRGKVMDTYFGGQIYGVEKFLPGGRSIWEDARGCMYGTWEQVGAQICFSYEDDPSTPDCWTYFEADIGLSAQLNGDPDAEPIFLRPSDYAMTCNAYLGA